MFDHNTPTRVLLMHAYLKNPTMPEDIINKINKRDILCVL